MLANAERWNNILSHVRAMHTEFTAIEIGNVLGEPSTYVTEAARELGVKCIKEKDKLIKLIKENLTLTATEISKKCPYTPQRITDVAAENGIQLPKGTRGKPTRPKKVKSEFHNIKVKKNNTVRPPAEYTQTASPFRIATDLNGITTK